MSEESGLVWDNLPGSIQDAVKVTVSLGYRFLWVDSLCIVQDDTAEMAQQIALMPQIYSNAAFTILVARAEKAVDGFLYPHVPTHNTQLAVKVHFHGPRESTTSAASRIGHIYLVDERETRNPEPIDSRGWALQERYLSPRVLEFASKGVAWTCCTHSKDEQSTDGWITPSYKMEFPPTFRLQYLQQLKPQLNCLGDGFSAAECHFFELVKLYTRRELSEPRDRILAISGIAELMLPIMGGSEYKAGIWTRRLRNCLLWRVQPIDRKPRPKEYQAPSWSWAGVNGEVNYHFSTYAEVAMEELHMEVYIELAHISAPCGAVREGRLTGQGRILRALWFGRQKLQSTREHQSRHSLHRLVQASEEPSPTSVVDIPMLQMYPDAIEEEFDGKPNTESWLADISGDTSYIKVHLLLFGILENYRQMTGPIGLVLREVKVSTPLNAERSLGVSNVKRYTRLGMFTTNREINPNGMAVEGEETEAYLKGLFGGLETEKFEII